MPTVTGCPFSLKELGSTYADIARETGVSTAGIWMMAQKMAGEERPEEGEKH